jgi:nucleoside-diphosphate-sugar epimerase
VRVFVAGATGVIGAPLVRELVAAGHEVTGTSRRERGAAEIRAAGAEAAAVDALDAGALRQAVVAARPEVVVHQLTDFPDRIRPRQNYTAATSRLRVEGTRNLVEAARAAGARRIVAQSIAIIYEPTGGPVKDEDAPLVDADPVGAAVAELERLVLGAEGMEGVVLRYGWLYGAGTWYSREGSYGVDARRRMLPIVGDGEGLFSFVHVEDAATATVAAIERGAPGVYNVVDDEPAPMREWVPAFAAAIGAPRPMRIPLWLTRVLGGKMAVRAADLRGASNEKAKRELGWRPRYPTWRQGFREALAPEAR